MVEGEAVISLVMLRVGWGRGEITPTLLPHVSVQIDLFCYYQPLGSSMVVCVVVVAGAAVVVMGRNLLYRFRYPKSDFGSRQL